MTPAILWEGFTVKATYRYPFVVRWLHGNQWPDHVHTSDQAFERRPELNVRVFHNATGRVRWFKSGLAAFEWLVSQEMELAA